MKLRESAISLSLLLSMSIGTFIPRAQAAIPHSESRASADRFASTLRDVYSLDQKSRKKVFHIRNHKGESISRGAGRTLETGLWSTQDPIRDGVEGTSTDKAYQNFSVSNVDIVVAVIDSGVDITHEDLKGHIWVNTQEMFGQPGVDDDHDGYVDDIYGWNFLGNKNGQNVDASTYEVTRQYVALKAKQDAGTITAEENALFTQQVEPEYTAGMKDAQDGLKHYQDFDAAIRLLKASGLVEESVAGLDAVTSQDPVVLQAIQLAKLAFEQDMTSADIKDGLDYYQMEVDYNYSLTFSSSDIVGDNPLVMNEKGYGNGDVTGPDASHGTHVAGIIAADRTNNLGINGQALNVKIMPLRVVPNGDERDKDVANAIRFAVDHHARVINMSFGKDYSPNKDAVDAAAKYAEAAGVIIVHAAGNDSHNTEFANNYPTKKVSNGQGDFRDIETWIEVGASTKVKGVNLAADYSNYGKKSVDIFAPGDGIVSTVPGNKYTSMSGTSMASPEAAGVAALLLERYPNATAQEVKHAMMTTANQYEGLSCDTPGTADATSPTLVNFSDLSASGGTVNAYEAMVQMQSL